MRTAKEADKCGTVGQLYAQLAFSATGILKYLKLVCHVRQAIKMYANCKQSEALSSTYQLNINPASLPWKI